MTTIINIVLYQPDIPYFKQMNAYLEVIESLRWGLCELGYESRLTINQINHRAINIIFGWIPAYHRGAHTEFPPNSILYNLEQLSDSIRGAAVAEHAAANFQIWDYSQNNLPKWQELSPKYPVYHALISFAPSLMRVPQAQNEDIDMLYIGSLSAQRAEKLIAATAYQDSIVNLNSLVSLTGIWGRQRDEFIGRAKVLLNVSHGSPIFEVARVSYYLANQKAVLCELCPDAYVEPDLQQVLRFATVAQLGQAGDELIQDPQLRTRYARDCFDIFSQRDVRDVIRGFFQ